MWTSEDSQPRDSWLGDIAIAGALVVIGVLLRLLCVSWPNFSPVAGLALLAGLTLRHRSLAVFIPIMTMLISDQFLTGYEFPVMVSVYGCLVAPVFLGRLGRTWLLKSQSRLWMRALGLGTAAGLASSILFFLVTNATYWMTFEIGHRSLWQCYIDGLPFFRYTASGDLIFSMVATLVTSSVAVFSRAAQTSAAIKTES